MTRMTGPDCAVMSNLINTHTYILPCHTKFQNPHLDTTKKLDVRLFFVEYQIMDIHTKYWHCTTTVHLFCEYHLASSLPAEVESVADYSPVACRCVSVQQQQQFKEKSERI